MTATNVRQIPDNETYDQFLARVKTRTVEYGDCWIFDQPQQKRGKGPNIIVYDNGKRRAVDVRRRLMDLAGKTRGGLGYFGRNLVMITCGEARCVNPSHCKMASRSEVVEASIERTGWPQKPTRRARLAAKAAQYRKLTPDQVAAIRIDPRSIKAVGAEYGIPPSTVARIRNFKSYASVGVGMFTGLMR